MWSAATVLVCALDILGRSASSFPPIVLLGVRPPNVSSQAEGFVLTGQSTIFLLTEGAAFQRLRRSNNRCGDLNAVRKIASVLVHEEWHVLNGPDERGAYDAQLMALTLMRAGPGNPVYAGVQRSRDEALAEQRQAALAALANAAGGSPGGRDETGQLARGAR